MKQLFSIFLYLFVVGKMKFAPIDREQLIGNISSGTLRFSFFLERAVPILVAILALFIVILVPISFSTYGQLNSKGKL